MIKKAFKYVGYLSIILLVTIIWFFLGFLVPPLHVLITMIMVIVILCFMLNKEHWIYWLLTILLFIITGGFYIFNNDLPGPMQWYITDNFVDVPSLWFDNYRFYWWGVIINTTFQTAGLISFCLLTLLKIIKRIKG